MRSGGPPPAWVVEDVAKALLRARRYVVTVSADPYWEALTETEREGWRRAAREAIAAYERARASQG